MVHAAHACLYAERLLTWGLLNKAGPCVEYPGMAGRCSGCRHKRGTCACCACSIADQQWQWYVLAVGWGRLQRLRFWYSMVSQYRMHGGVAALECKAHAAAYATDYPPWTAGMAACGTCPGMPPRNAAKGVYL